MYESINVYVVPNANEVMSIEGKTLRVFVGLQRKARRYCPNTSPTNRAAQTLLYDERAIPLRFRTRLEKFHFPNQSRC